MRSKSISVGNILNEILSAKKCHLINVQDFRVVVMCQLTLTTSKSLGYESNN